MVNDLLCITCHVALHTLDISCLQYFENNRRPLIIQTDKRYKEGTTDIMARLPLVVTVYYLLGLWLEASGGKCQLQGVGG
jgi:hypothetical protein